MAKKTYYEKLKDPRWQKKRLEALADKEFMCECCYDSESTLHVHHKEYFKDREPWEYNLNQLAVLCESCHEIQHETKDLFKYISSILDMDGPRDRNSIAFILAGYIGLDYQEALSNSGHEDCAFAKAFYEYGNKLNTLDIELAKYIRTYEAKNA